MLDGFAKSLFERGIQSHATLDRDVYGYLGLAKER